MVLSTGGVERVWNNDTSIPYLRAMYVIENAQLVRAEGSVQLEAHAAEMFRIGIGDRLSELSLPHWDNKLCGRESKESPDL